MNVFIQLDEVYLEWIFPVCKELRSRSTIPLSFYAIAIRRKTVLKKVALEKEGLGIVSCDWWNEIEKKIIKQPYSPERLCFYREKLGDRSLRKLISCDRDLGHGFLSGGLYAHTPLRKYVEESDENRWNYIVRVLDYFYELFLTKEISYVLLTEITFSWELAAYYIAEYLKIPCLLPSYTRSGGGYLIVNNPYQKCSDVELLYEKSLKNPACLRGACLLAKKEVIKFRNKPIIPEYSVENRKKIKSQATLLGMLRTLLVDIGKCFVMHLGMFGTKGFLRQENWWNVLWVHLKSFYYIRKTLFGFGFERFSGEKIQYIYYPLHVEPESTTMILSEHMTNQLSLIEHLSKNLPAGWKLLVKEHIPMLGRRPAGFYKRIRHIPDVHMISPFEDTFTLIKNAKIVCVLSGTAGWEAIQLGIPIIIFGKAQYLGIKEGFIQCENIFNLDKYIQNAIDLSPVSIDKIATFIAATKAIQTKMTPQAICYWHYGINPKKVILKEGINQLVDQIIKKSKQNVKS